MDILSFALGMKLGAGKGAGGGSLPAGAYWKQMAPPTKPNCGGRYFDFNGKTYFVARTVASTSQAGTGNREVYLVENDAYTLVTEGTAFPHDSSMRKIAIIEYGGKIHMLGERTGHMVWDGSAFARAATMPYEVNSKCAAVWNGELYLFSFYNGCYLFKWVEATDTYEVICQIKTNAPNKYSTGNLFVKDGNLYLSAQKSLYVYENGNFTLLRTSDITIGNTFSLFDGKYIWSAETSNRLYKYHIDTNTYDDYGPLPYYAYSYWSLDIASGKLRLHVEYNSNVVGANLELHVVE